MGEGRRRGEVGQQLVNGVDVGRPGGRRQVQSREGDVEDETPDTTALANGYTVTKPSKEDVETGPDHTGQDRKEERSSTEDTDQ